MQEGSAGPGRPVSGREELQPDQRFPSSGWSSAVWLSGMSVNPPGICSPLRNDCGHLLRQLWRRGVFLRLQDLGTSAGQKRPGSPPWFFTLWGQRSGRSSPSCSLNSRRKRPPVCQQLRGRPTSCCCVDELMGWKTLSWRRNQRLHSAAHQPLLTPQPSRPHLTAPDGCRTVWPPLISCFNFCPPTHRWYLPRSVELPAPKT